LDPPQGAEGTLAASLRPNGLGEAGGGRRSLVGQGVFDVFEPTQLGNGQGPGGDAQETAPVPLVGRGHAGLLVSQLKQHVALGELPDLLGEARSWHPPGQTSTL